MLKDINLTIEDGGRYGLVGVNGAGKSTLLSIIMKETDYDSGELYTAPDLTIGYLKQNSGLDRGSTVIRESRNVFSNVLKVENDMRLLEKKMQGIANHGTREYNKLMGEYSKKQAYFESCDGYNIDVKIKMVLNGMGFSGMDLDTEITTLSGGEKTRLAIAMLLLKAPKLLILDEPTNHLDFRTLDWLENYLSDEYKGALLIVSHDRYFLDVTVENMFEIEKHKLYTYKGNYSNYVDQRAQRVANWQKEYEKQQLEIEKMQTYVEKNINRASTSAMAKSRMKVLENMEIIEKPDFETKPIKLKFEMTKEPYKDVLTVSDLDVSVGEPPMVLCQNIDFELKRGEKIALIGDNGIGKSSFLKTLLGINPHYKGEVLWGRGTTVSYYEQENLNLNHEKLAIDELRDRFPQVPDVIIRNMLGGVRLTREDVFKPVGVISGGERAKLAFCIIMLEKSNVILFDEPTNHLDLPSKEVLEQAMQDYAGTLLFVSHDRYLLNNVPDKIVEMTKDGFVLYDGNYEYYKSRRDWLARRETDTKSKKKSKLAPKRTGGYRSKEQRRAEAHLKQRIAELENLITKTEEHIAEIESEMANPEIFSDYATMNEKTRELHVENENLEQYYREWEEIAE